LWEGVTLYLSKKETQKNLKQIKKNAAASSIIIADFYVNQFVNGDVISSKKKFKNTRKNE
jgi:O-methyltransferase involved in polyketide biosynthesis